MKRNIIFALCLPALVSVGLLFTAAFHAVVADERPNIVFIMSDDHSAGAISSYGSRLIQTPGIDRLAQEGMRFDNCFVPLSLCAPSRAAILTGQHPHKNGMMRNYTPLDVSLPTFPKVLQTSGYQTALVGKWHLISQPQGFDFYSIMDGQGRYFDCPFLESGRPWPDVINAQTLIEDPRRPDQNTSDGPAPMVIRPGYLTDVITDTAITWLENRDKNKPFCLLIHHKAAHTPHRYPERFEQLFTEDIPYPATFTDDWKTRDTLRQAEAIYSKFTLIFPGDIQGNELGNRPIMDRSDPGAFRPWAYQVFMKGYLRLVASMDENIVRLLDYLDQAGLSDNTLVIYTSDNGFFLGDHGLYNKMWMYEESLRVPLIVRFPGKIAKETVCTQMVSTLDFAPTFAALAGAEQPKEFQGSSLLPLFADAKTSAWTREVHYYHYYGQYGVPSHFGIRTASHKLLCFYDIAEEPVWELFDLTSDPNELVNLAGKPQHTALLASMKKRLIEEIEENGAVLPETVKKTYADFVR